MRLQRRFPREKLTVLVDRLRYRFLIGGMVELIFLVVRCIPK